VGLSALRPGYRPHDGRLIDNGALRRTGGAMMTDRKKTPDLSPQEIEILRAEWEWAGHYAIFWVIGTIMIFGGAQFLFDYLGADGQLRTTAFILLATLILLNAIWRAAGAVVARLERARAQQDQREQRVTRPDV
jgi:hypothetical protein